MSTSGKNVLVNRRDVTGAEGIGRDFVFESLTDEQFL
jgi:hypothetical protein